MLLRAGLGGLVTGLCGWLSQVKEVALMHSEGILAGEMKHGPLALVDEHLPIIVIATRDSMHGKMHSVIQQLLARQAKLICFVSEVPPPSPTCNVKCHEK
jgi:glucosamine 6-phosphate synthetase-like amidotransferase/phosphosugar isomerase protein